MRAAAAMGPATAMGRTAAMGCPHRKVGCPAAMWTTAAMRATSHRAARRAAAMRATAVRGGGPHVECRSAMTCGCAMEPGSAVECRSAVGGRHSTERCLPMRRGSAAVDRSRAETPAMRCPVPEAGCRGQRGSPRRIEARSRGRVGIGNAAAMGSIVHPNAAREGDVAARGERIATGVDGDCAMSPINPSPAPKRAERRQYDRRFKADPEPWRIGEPDWV